ncbi:TraB/GumN family protein [Arenimonas sp. MALMAid1274]|uniref:TraB/GumN family protein n=1 Tax=Arenimonas sp. MALMAid1274 TaxID=3411630 RepID=UPI003BA30EAB
MRWTACLLLALLVPTLHARERPPATTADEERDAAALAELADDAGLQLLDTVVVSGVQPGPGLWKVSRDGRVLWVLGTVTPLPKRMEWNSADVERRIAASGVVLLPPRVDVQAKGAALGGVFLIPSLMRARNNPGKEKLQDVLPAADYARWQALKARYLGRDAGVEKRRPILAAMELRDEALDDHDLSTRDIVRRAVDKAARQGDVPIERPTIVLVVEDAKAALKEFAASPVDDLACFRRTLDQVENDLDTLATRANAWAIGEVAMLAALPYTDNAQACTDALLQTWLAQRSGFSDLPERVKAAWLEAAEKALATHSESFAVLPMVRVVGASGWLDVLAQRGYTVEAPADSAAAAASP